VRLRHAQSEDGLDASELFAGVGGFGIGLRALGIPVLAWSEYDPHAKRQVNQQVLRHRFPLARGLGDVADVTYASLRRPKLITAGSPCQGFSLAGMRKGMLDERSALFAEFVRIRDEGIEDGRLECAVWENVPGALSSNKGEDFANVLGAMVGSDPLPLPRLKGRTTRWAGVARGGLGFFAWRVLDARHFGVAQRRQRVFGVWTRDRSCIEILFGPEGVAYYQNVEADVSVPGSGYVTLFDVPEVPFNSTMAPDDPSPVKLSSVLEWDVDEKYYLSQKACLGILTRSTRRGRKLPAILHRALWEQAGRPEEFTPESFEDDDGRFSLGMPVAFDWQASGDGDTSFRGKSRIYMVRKGDTSGTLQNNKTEAVAVPVLSFATATLNSPEDRTAIRPDDPGPTLTDPSKHPVAVVVPAYGLALRGRGGANVPELGEEELANAVRGNGGGSSYPMALVPFRKSQRAHHKDDHETWVSDGATNTPNEFDLGKDVRACDVVVAPVATINALGAAGVGVCGADDNQAQAGHLIPVVGFNVDPESGQGADLKARQTDTAPALLTNWIEKTTDRGLRVVDVLTYRVRRITPKECERLQGFPDDHTLVGDAKDSHRYRQMGNAVAVPCATWVLARVRAVLEWDVDEMPTVPDVLEMLPWLRDESSTEYRMLILPGSGPSETSDPSSNGESPSSKATSSKRRLLRVSA
jgi:site-specific DNA-cytosine methylase